MDYINDLSVSPTHITMLSNVIHYIEQNDAVVDVGGGTGLFARQIFRSRPGMRLTFIEPSEEMLDLAKQKLPCSVNYINKSIYDSFDLVSPNQNVFLFFRSLYAIVSSEDDVRNLITRVAEKLLKDGKIIIYDLISTIDANESYKPFLKKLKVSTPEDEVVFEAYWAMHTKMNAAFSEEVLKGNFKTFTKDELVSVFSRMKYRLLHYEKAGNRYGAVFQKIS